MDILVIEDDKRINETIKLAWPDRSSYLKFVSSYKQSIPLKHGTNVAQFDAIVADIFLPDGSGLDILRKVRRVSNIPFLIISGYGDPSSRADAIDCGADDYVMKPFAVRELHARTRRQIQIRNERKTERPKVAFTLGEIECDLQRLKLLRQGRETDLTPMEGRVLEMLWNNRNCEVSKAEIYKTALHRQHDLRDKTLEVYISRIRKKLNADGDGTDCIQTIRGIGYRLIADN